MNIFKFCNCRDNNISNVLSFEVKVMTVKRLCCRDLTCIIVLRVVTVIRLSVHDVKASLRYAFSQFMIFLYSREINCFVYIHNGCCVDDK